MVGRDWRALMADCSASAMALTVSGGVWVPKEIWALPSMADWMAGAQMSLPLMRMASCLWRLAVVISAKRLATGSVKVMSITGWPCSVLPAAAEAESGGVEEDFFFDAKSAGRIVRIGQACGGAGIFGISDGADFQNATAGDVDQVIGLEEAVRFCPVKKAPKAYEGCAFRLPVRRVRVAHNWGGLAG